MACPRKFSFQTNQN
jgi:WD40 repeat protein